MFSGPTQSCSLAICNFDGNTASVEIYIILTSLFVANKSFFNDLKPWKEEYVGIGVHWLERKVQDALINFEIKPNADYIYES